MLRKHKIWNDLKCHLILLACDRFTQSTLLRRDAARDEHDEMNNRRVIHIVNLDPTAEAFNYKPLVDIRDLIYVDGAIEV